MSLRRLLPALAAASCLLAADAGLLEVRKIYLLPMSGGLDQYLANRLTRTGRYVVVADPNAADALLTDQLGASFEEKFRELYPPPPPPKEEKDKDKDKKEEQSVVSMMGESSGKGSRLSAFSRGRGNVFLVDRATKQVVWSVFLRPRNTRPEEMNRTADQIVDKLDGEAGKRQKKALRSEAKPVDVKPAPEVKPVPVVKPAPAPEVKPAPATPAPAPAPAK